MLFELDAQALLWRIAGTLVANLLLALFAFFRKSVDRSGAVMGFILGSLIFLGGGLPAWVVLTAFFLSSSALSKAGRKKKARLESLHEKGHTRDAAQAFANAGIGSLAMGIYAFFPWAPLLHIFTGSMAVATADTWSSELGVLSPGAPRSVLSFKRVEPGTSGGVTVLGTAASLAGALLIFASSLVFYRSQGIVGASLEIAVAICLAALAGSFIDSVLGAGAQALYRDDEGNLTEKPNGNLVRGISWLNNDVVNLISNFLGSIICVLIISI
jgi:uncharacterized protein (TIGR00297 family)